MKTKNLLTAAVALLMAGAAQAQTNTWTSYSFIEAQGGVQLTSTNAPMDKLITPTAALSFGHYFTPVVGARLHVNAWQSKSGLASTGQYYKWKYVTPDLDLLVNLTNLFGKGSDHALNVILLGGVGLNYAWDNDELKDLNLPANTMPLAWDKNRLGHNLRAGLRLETNQAKPFGVSLEVNANSLDDRFNSKTNDKDDWMFTAMLGLNFRFGHKKAAPRYVTKTIEVIDTFEVDEPITIKVKEKQPKTKTETKHMKMNEAIFFKIRESDANAASGIDEAIKKVAELMKCSDDAMFTVTGYADKGTGSAKMNKKYAKQRADDVAKKLVEQYGLDAKRLKTDSKGDTVQPFEENDKNRCVIVTGEGTFRITTTEMVEVEVEKQSTKKVQKTKTREVQIQEEIK
ncbi:OmpA family protein [Prevotella communis]|uniref:OmpA family protein n=1 Tax=Prevotella communis TaxID=2913614 RepID=UPI001ED9FBF9|nr:OmpA family protein [Prevotella communis]UKK56601.1 OmpA family protein [Prevotella communis]UKK59354.1 OmpA family protein [Prevotella communis]UKK62120.1 OmpA family protein [Prevotella communis]UKK64947.1 OmpA family protein [Prevotella communis]UKK67320.1 OmpA family protein [Prevotella communis]